MWTEWILRLSISERHSRGDYHAAHHDYHIHTIVIITVGTYYGSRLHILQLPVLPRLVTVSPSNDHRPIQNPPVLPVAEVEPF